MRSEPGKGRQPVKGMLSSRSPAVDNRILGSLGTLGSDGGHTPLFCSPEGRENEDIYAVGLWIQENQLPNTLVYYTENLLIFTSNITFPRHKIL